MKNRAYCRVDQVVAVCGSEGEIGLNYTSDERGDKIQNVKTALKMIMIIADVKGNDYCTLKVHRLSPRTLQHK